MASAAELLLKLLVDDKATPALDKAGGAAKTMSVNWRAAAGVVSGAGSAVLGVMADLAREGAADEASMLAVKVAVDNAGGSWATAEAQISTYIDKMRDTAAVSDDQMKPALAGLIATTGDYEKSMGLASIAADLARGKNMSLSTAAELVGKVSEGNVGILKRYGITLDENATAEEGLAELQKRFAGQAEAYGSSTKGTLDGISLKIGDFRETLGSALGPAQLYLGLLPGLSAGFSGMAAAVGFLTGEQAKNIAGMVTHRAASVLGAAATATVTAAQWLLNAALAANPIGIVVLAIAGLVAAFAIAWASSEDFRRIVTGVFNDVTNVVRTAVNSILGFINSLIRAWNGLELSLPGFEIPLPGGASIGWGGVTLGTPDLPEIPLLDRGGIVTRPTLAMLAGNGIPEAVIPLGSGGAGGGTVVYVTVQGSVIAERDLATVIRDELRAMGRRNVEVGLL